MKPACLLLSLLLAFCNATQAADPPAQPTIVVAEGERFAPQDKTGWKVVSQDDSYATQTFGAMWVTHGGLLKATANTTDAVATQHVAIPADGRYRVWSKYQAPPYFHFPHRVEIRQNGKLVFTHDYGKITAKKLYSFGGKTVYGLPPVSQVWFSWGVDHDAAEAPTKPVTLKKGKVEIRLIATKGSKPSGDRCIDFLLLTSNHEDTCEGWQKHGQAKSPFMFEAIHATPIYFRFRNTIGQPAKARLFTHFGHFTWHCGPKRALVPNEAIAPNAWSPWTNINRVVELFTDEGLQVSLVPPDADRKTVAPKGKIEIQFARDSAGKDSLGNFQIANGDTINFPIDVIWNRDKKLKRSEEIARELIAASKTSWRKASPHKPQQIAFFGAFGRGHAPYAEELKNALGYNTQLDDKYKHLPVHGYHQHLRNPEQIEKYAQNLGPQKRNFRVCSFGDEIHIGGINANDPKYLEPFRKWLRAKRLTKTDLGIDPAAATLNGNPRLIWYTRLFGAEQRFAHYRSLTAVAKKAFGKQVLCGANFSPHHDVMYYGNQLQWIDAFKHNAMSMFWTEDYIFFVPELPQTISFMFARMHCAVKYNRQPIHMYVMPHAPGQPADYFRRNSLLSVGAGAQHIDHFWVGPQENYSENYVSWQHPETFQAIFESIYDTAAAEPLLKDARRRAARVAVITGKATALNEDAAPIDIGADRFLKMSHITGKPVQNICRKDQQMLYLALRHAQLEVDLITEDDIIEDGILKKYDVVYFAGEWIHDKAVGKLDTWVRDGGILYASTGLGIRNQFNEPHDGLAKLLGVKAGSIKKNLYHVRPLLELPLASAIDTIQMGDEKIDAIAFRQSLTPVSKDVDVIGRWRDGSAAVSVRTLGKGQAIAVGTAAGLTYMKTGTRPLPWARGGRTNLYNPEGFSPLAKKLVRLGSERGNISSQVRCSEPSVEALLLDNTKGTLVTLVNWTNQPNLEGLEIELVCPRVPREVRSVTLGRAIPFTKDGKTIRFSTKLQAADYLMVLY